MFGFLIGTLSLIGLVKVLRAGDGRTCGGNWDARGRDQGHWNHPRDGSHRDHWGRDGGGDSNHRESSTRAVSVGRDEAPFGLIPLRFLFEALDTTVGQEKVIKAAYKEVREAIRHGEGEAEETRAQVANAIRRGTVDETEMGELYARQDEKLRTLRSAFFGALAKVTDALDEDQRKKLADMLERSERSVHRGGPYRQPGN